VKSRSDQNRRGKQLGRADPEDQPPHRPEAAEGEFEPDREEQQDHAELRRKARPPRGSKW
jgi:hypothetical protein